MGGCFAYADISRECWPLHGCKGLLCFVIFRPDAIGSDVFHHLCQMLLILISDSEFSVTTSKCYHFAFSSIYMESFPLFCVVMGNVIISFFVYRNKEIRN